MVPERMLAEDEVQNGHREREDTFELSRRGAGILRTPSFTYSPPVW